MPILNENNAFNVVAYDIEKEDILELEEIQNIDILEKDKNTLYLPSNIIIGKDNLKKILCIDCLDIHGNF